MKKNNNSIDELTSQESLADQTSEHAVRLHKIEQLKELGIDPWPYARETNIDTKEIVESYDPQQESPHYKIAGRIMIIREHGKTIFAKLQDVSGQIQIYIKQDIVGEEQFTFFKKFIDLGDIVWCLGQAFMTKTGEITLKVIEYTLLSKCLFPLPEKFHGLSDVEIRYRQRYLDLIMNKESRERFITRSTIIKTIRKILDNQDFLEVETPMLHPIPGGATAKPFVTHHNALHMDLYLRIAPELYLKELIIGGYERVYEINRCFRNEGISTKHNPEFTTIELYVANHDYIWMMDFAEQLIRTIVSMTHSSQIVEFGSLTLHFDQPFKKMTMIEAICSYGSCTLYELEPEQIGTTLLKHKISLGKKEATHGEKLYALFDQLVEHQLIQPTFVTQLPIEASPLAKRNPQSPAFADRFELFIAGMEISNAYNELNDPFYQAERFKEQASLKEHGDEEAHYYDAEFIKALEYGLPPTVGFGMGIDRLAMLLTNAPSIRDVILFPTLKKQVTK